MPDPKKVAQASSSLASAIANMTGAAQALAEGGYPDAARNLEKSTRLVVGILNEIRSSARGLSKSTTQLGPFDQANRDAGSSDALKRAGQEKIMARAIDKAIGMLANDSTDGDIMRELRRDGLTAGIGGEAFSALVQAKRKLGLPQRSGRTPMSTRRPATISLGRRRRAVVEASRRGLIQLESVAQHWRILASLPSGKPMRDHISSSPDLDPDDLMDWAKKNKKSDPKFKAVAAALRPFLSQGDEFERLAQPPRSITNDGRIYDRTGKTGTHIASGQSATEYEDSLGNRLWLLADGTIAPD